jgi:hypothetical protein
MKLSSQLAERSNEILLTGKWVTGTNIKEQIRDLDWKLAIKKIETLNTIADLVFHINYYLAGVADVLEGGQLVIKDKYSFDAPPIKSEQDWKDRVDKFCTDSERFVALVKKLSNEDLLKPFTDEKYGNYLRNIDVILEHSYYHFGQIVLIKKMLENNSKK